MTEGNGEVRELPEGWIQLKLEDVAEWGSGGTPSRKNPDYFKGDIPWIKTGELKGKYIRNAEERITREAINESSAKIFPKGSVAIAMYGATIGKTSIIDIDASTNQACAVAKPLKEILFNEFLYYYLFSQTRKFVELGKGGAQPNISQTLLKSHPIPLPPINEQDRIVEKIEELFSDVDQGVKSLKTAQKQLKVYRQAVLKWAFEGKLTEEWRKQQSTLKTGEALLAQIKAERENRYLQQLAEWEKAVEVWEAIGKVGKKPTKPQPFSSEALSQNESKSLSPLPETWNWVTLRELTILEPRNGYSPKPVSYFTNTKSLTLTATTSGKFNPKYFKYIDEKIEPSSYLWLEENDVLIQRGNTIEYVGTAAIYRGKSQEFIYPDLMMRTRFASCLNVSYVYQAINSEYSRAYFRDRATGTAGSMPKINKGTVNSLPIPLPSREEQEQIIEEIELRLSICDQLEATIIGNLQKAEALRQSILKQAFEGKLVPQDPNDEPAEKLLEHIRAERQEKQQLQLLQQLKIKGV